MPTCVFSVTRTYSVSHSELIIQWCVCVHLGVRWRCFGCSGSSVLCQESLRSVRRCPQSTRHLQVREQVKFKNLLNLQHFSVTVCFVRFSHICFRHSGGLWRLRKQVTDPKRHLSLRSALKVGITVQYVPENKIHLDYKLIENRIIEKIKESQISCICISNFLLYSENIKKIQVNKTNINHLNRFLFPSLHNKSFNSQQNRVQNRNGKLNHKTNKL